LAKYPDISINYHTHQLASDYFPMGADLAIIVHKLKDSSLCYRKLGDVRHVMCASPQYIAQHGKPATPHDLKNFNFIEAQYAHVPKNYEWGMSKDGVFYPAEVSGNLRVDDSMTVKKLVMDGAGITSLPSFTIREEVAEGKLVVLLEDYEVGSMPVYVVFPEKKYMPPKVRVFLDMLAASFEANPMFK
jgi:DNA-binding transcriptional LysR family regulator